MERPARVRIRRRKPWVLCRRRLFGWNVRLLNGVHSTRGAWADESEHRVVSCESRQSRSTSTAYLRPCGRVVDMRHRSTPVSTCQRYVLAVNRVNSAGGSGVVVRHAESLWILLA